MVNHKDVYTILAEKHGFGNSDSYLRVLRFLMTPEQAGIVTLLPGSPEEVAQKSSADLTTVKDLLRWKPKYSLRDTMEELYPWVVSDVKKQSKNPKVHS